MVIYYRLFQVLRHCLPCANTKKCVNNKNTQQYEHMLRHCPVPALIHGNASITTIHSIVSASCGCTAPALIGSNVNNKNMLRHCPELLNGTAALALRPYAAMLLSRLLTLYHRRAACVVLLTQCCVCCANRESFVIDALCTYIEEQQVCY